MDSLNRSAIDKIVVYTKKSNFISPNTWLMSSKSSNKGQQKKSCTFSEQKFREDGSKIKSGTQVYGVTSYK